MRTNSVGDSTLPVTQDELTRRLAGYSISALALTGALSAGASPASAQIVATTLTHPLTVSASSDPVGIVIDFNTMTAQYNTRFTGPGQVALYGYYNSNRSHDQDGFVLPGVDARVLSAGGGLAEKYGLGHQVPGAGRTVASRLVLFESGTKAAVGDFLPSDTTNRGFVGVEFLLTAKPDVYFGWVDVGVDPEFDVTLYGFGYNATNSTEGAFADPALAGAGETPEPSPLALLLLGGFAGMAAYRAAASARRRHHVAAA